MFDGSLYFKASSKKNASPIGDWQDMNGAAGRIRTHDPLVRSQVLYPTELQPRESESIAQYMPIYENKHLSNHRK